MKFHHGLKRCWIRIVSAPDKELFEHTQTLLSCKLVRHDKGDTKDEKSDMQMGGNIISSTFPLFLLLIRILIFYSLLEVTKEGQY